MPLNTQHLCNTLRALESATTLYQQALAAEDAIGEEIYRMAIVKGFELVQEVCFKLIKRRLKAFGHGGRKLEATPIKEVLRFAAQHDLVTLAEVERWFVYRDNRNNTAHDYGNDFIAETLAVLPEFIADARALEARLHSAEDAEGESS